MEKRFKSFRLIWIPILFVLGMLLGILLVYCYREGFLSRAGILSSYYIKKLKYLEPDRMAMGEYVIKKRLWFWLVCVLILIGRFKNPALLLGSVILGTMAGILTEICVLKFGLTGLLLMLALILPQWLFYGWGCFFWLKGKIGNVFRGGVLILLGILTESYLNFFVIQLIVKLL